MRSSTPVSTDAQFPLSNVVIVGAAPSGLILAIRLKQLGVKKVTLVDPRAGEYTRSGDFVRSVFTDISDAIKLPITPSHAEHIKDAERQLYQHAYGLNAKFVRKKFLGFKDKHILVGSEDEKSEHLIPCDIVFDCTGTTRAVIKAFNQLNEQPYFTITNLGTSPHTQYMLARLKMDAADVQYFNSTAPCYHENTGTHKELAQIIAIEDLRKMGWEHYSLPYCYINPSQKDKANFYTQAPKNLTPEQYEKWVEKIFSAKRGDHSLSYTFQKQSKTYPNKAVISYFCVEPSFVAPLYNVSNQNLPVIIPVGDSSLATSFALAASLKNGITRIQALIDNMTVVDGQIQSISFVHYENAYQIAKDDISFRTFSMNARRENDLAKDFNKLIELYQKGLGANIPNQALRRSLQTSLSSIRLLQQEEQKNKQINATKAKPIVDREALKTLNNKFFDTNGLLLEKVSATEHRNELIELAAQLKHAGVEDFTLSLFGNALVHFKTSLRIHEKFFDGEFANQQIILYSNLIQVYKKQQGVAEILKLQTAANRIIKLVTKDKDKFQAKIWFNTAEAILEKLNKKNKSDDEKEHNADTKLIDTASDLIDTLTENSHAKGAGTDKLKGKLDELRIKFEYKKEEKVNSLISFLNMISSVSDD